VLCLSFAGVEDQAFGEKFVEEFIEQADGFAVLVYVPDQELVVKRRNNSLFVLYSEQRA